ncbi:hypothetical protein DICPUDRAFT_82898 [Dictyostelium purpureum]|uniref:Myb-like domain-containing protein n=1 Tax=Dictyostelium purpureum TaxID=5786 RepID=F0ZXY7_DICPU|nr:uncharacterized protein DICPUDRAFT_82898 [Dictyostelium purpureum]EGC31190.1 hypothetical protein DICPUDRAFT_82898 [Dictyostelium purpureum]|eukprot:XP_003292279.1 hypothetical protein DICPUDRAFT_82898 [Dictyostelium purpureum]
MSVFKILSSFFGFRNVEKEKEVSDNSEFIKTSDLFEQTYYHFYNNIFFIDDVFQELSKEESFGTKKQFFFNLITLKRHLLLEELNGDAVIELLSNILDHFKFKNNIPSLKLFIHEVYNYLYFNKSIPFSEGIFKSILDGYFDSFIYDCLVEFNRNVHKGKEAYGGDSNANQLDNIFKQFQAFCDAIKRELPEPLITRVSRIKNRNGLNFGDIDVYFFDIPSKIFFYVDDGNQKKLIRNELINSKNNENNRNEDNDDQSENGGNSIHIDSDEEPRDKSPTQQSSGWVNKKKPTTTTTTSSTSTSTSTKVSSKSANKRKEEPESESDIDYNDGFESAFQDDKPNNESESNVESDSEPSGSESEDSYYEDDSDFSEKLEPSGAGKWDEAECNRLARGLLVFGPRWTKISNTFLRGIRSETQIKDKLKSRSHETFIKEYLTPSQTKKCLKLKSKLDNQKNLKSKNKDEILKKKNREKKRRSRENIKKRKEEELAKEERKKKESENEKKRREERKKREREREREEESSDENAEDESNDDEEDIIKSDEDVMISKRKEKKRKVETSDKEKRKKKKHKKSNESDIETDESDQEEDQEEYINKKKHDKKKKHRKSKKNEDVISISDSEETNNSEETNDSETDYEKSSKKKSKKNK